MKYGLKAALEDQLVQKKIELIFENDYYEPPFAY